MRASYVKVLDRLAQMLKAKPMTAKAICKAMKCSKVVAHERVKALKEQGHTLYTVKVRESPSGPKSTAHGIR